MSTTCKLDPTVRRARHARRGLLTHLTRVMQRTPMNYPHFKWLVDSTALMHATLHASNLTGEEKNVIATRIADEFRKITAVPVARSKIAELTNQPDLL